MNTLVKLICFSFLMFFTRFFSNIFKILAPDDPHKEVEVCGKATTLLTSWGLTLTDLLNAIERADNEIQMRKTVDKLNDVMLCFLSEFDERSRRRCTRRCLSKLGVTDALSACLSQGATLREALNDYKEKTITKMNLMIKRRAKERIITQMDDCDIYERLFKSRSPPQRVKGRKRKLDKTEVAAGGTKHLLEQQRLRQSKLVSNKRKKFDNDDYQFLKQNGICFSFQSGQCRREDRCKYKHFKLVDQRD
jgi:hypothetical protein